MKKIQLTQGKFAIVDDDVYEYLMQWKWCAYKARNTFYATRRNGSSLFPTTIKMHRVVTNAPKGTEVDHIDGDGLNNQRSNLRVCLRIENAHNKRKQINNKSGYKGVYFDSQTKKFRAQLTINSTQRINLGRFSTAEEAAIAYDVKAKELFGEFAKTNFRS